MADEEKLLVNIKKKKRGSLERAIALYTPYLSTVCFNVSSGLLTKEDIEEVVSDTFVSLWKNAENLDSQKGCIRTYLGTIARNLSKNKLRKININCELNENVPYSDGDLQTDYENKERRQSIIELIAKLGEPDSEIFMRFYFYDERISQIALAMDMSISAIKTRLSRGRKRLREIAEKDRRYGNE